MNVLEEGNRREKRLTLEAKKNLPKVSQEKLKHLFEMNDLNFERVWMSLG